MTQYAPNTCFSVTIYLSIAWSNLLTGFLLTNFAATQKPVIMQLGWKADDSDKLKVTAINNLSVIGVMSGCLLAKNFLGCGRRRAVFLSNALSILGSLLCMILNFWAIAIGKLIFGFASGLMIVACSIYNKETLPANTLAYMGTSINTGIIIGLLISTTVQNLSIVSLTDQELAVTNLWRWPLGAPLIVSTVSILMWLIFLPEESIEYSLEKGQEDKAKKLLSRVYKFTSDDEKTGAMEEIKKMIQSEKNDNTAESPGYCEVLSSAKYRGCTALCIIAAFLNQFSGVNAISFYSTQIFEAIGLDLVLGGYLAYAGAVLGACSGPFMIRCFSVKQLMVTGEFILCVCCTLFVVFTIYDQPMLGLIAIIFFQFAYQITLGSFFFVYISQVAAEAINSYATAALWLSALLVNTAMPYMINAIGIEGVFSFFAASCLLAGIYLAIAQRSTYGLSKEELRVLYFPKKVENKELELKENTV